MEQRSEPRHRALLRVDYRSTQPFMADHTTDLGRGGLFVRTDRDFALGESVLLCISFPGLLEPTEMVGTVRWRRSAAEAAATKQPQGVGVAFDPGQEQAVARVAQLLDRIVSGTSMPPKARQFDVLLVEDNRFVQDLFRHALGRFHDGRASGASHETLQVHVAFTGHEAMRLLQTKRPNLAIVDHLLPGMTGARLVRLMRTELGLPDVPVLMVSAGGREARAEALEAGATVYLDKPVLLAQLVATIAAMLTDGG